MSIGLFDDTDFVSPVAEANIAALMKLAPKGRGPVPRMKLADMAPVLPLDPEAPRFYATKEIECDVYYGKLGDYDAEAAIAALALSSDLAVRGESERVCNLGVYSPKACARLTNQIIRNVASTKPYPKAADYQLARTYLDLFLRLQAVGQPWEGVKEQGHE